MSTKVDPNKLHEIPFTEIAYISGSALASIAACHPDKVLTIQPVIANTGYDQYYVASIGDISGSGCDNICEAVIDLAHKLGVEFLRIFEDEKHQDIEDIKKKHVIKKE